MASESFEQLEARIREAMPGLPEFLVQQAVFAKWILMQMAEAELKKSFAQPGGRTNVAAILAMYAATMRMAFAKTMQLFAADGLDGGNREHHPLLDLIQVIDTLEAETGIRPAGAPPILNLNTGPKLFVPGFDPTDN